VRAGGVGLVGACDIAVAGPRSTFAITEARIGVAAAVISVTVLPRLDARSAARYYLTGATFDATEAERIGLVTIATDDLDGAVASITADLRKGSPQGLVESKRRALGSTLRLRGSARGDDRIPRAAATSLVRLTQTD
jgi:enoyl-CoA hydratase